MLPSTPFLKIDEVRLDANIARVAAQARAAGVALRPHAKTHKSLEIARRQLAAGAVGLTVATIGEAEVFSAVSDDLFIAYPLWPDEDQSRRLRELGERVRLCVGVDSIEGISRLARLVRGASVLIEIDSGHHRTGVVASQAGALARRAEDAGLQVVGCFSFPGHSYAPGSGRTAAVDEASAIGEAGAAMARAGVPPRVLSGGSSPSLPYADAATLTEWRPGVYVFGDAQQWELGAMGPDQVALACVATVISTRGQRIVLDSGSKILGADRAAYASGFGRLLHHPEARVVSLSEHHAVVEMHGAAPAVGERLEIVPNHACNSVNLVDQLWLAGASEDLHPLEVTARGRTS